MHTIRTSARRLAWRTDSSNPFARTRTRTAYPNDEEALRRAQTRAQMPSHHRFISEGGNAPPLPDQPDFHRSHTLSELPEPHTYSASPTLQSNSASQTFGQSSEHPSAGSNETEKTLVPPVKKSPTANDSQGPRKRKRGIHIPWIKKGPEANYDTSHSAEDEKKKQKFTVGGQIRIIVFGSWVNLLLLFIPVGFAVRYTNQTPWAIFWLNFIAIVPLAGMLSFATEEIALRVGETLGGLLNATFGNAVELIVAVIALTQNQILIVQTSLIGSMLSNLLLVMGMCFFFGGLNRIEQYFNVTVAQTAASLAALAIGGLLVPTAFDAANPMITATSSQEAQISRGTAIVLLVVYACYLLFQLKTHASIYNEKSQKAPKRTHELSDGSAKLGLAQMAAGSAAMTGGQINHQNLIAPETENDNEKDDDEEEEPQISFTAACVTLLGATVLISFLADSMTKSIEGITATGAISTEFVGLILLPIVGNAAEHATAVTVACKDKMDLAIGVAIGSSMQIALLVLPLSVVLGWIIQPATPMTLDFDYFQITVLFVAILLVNYLIADGKSHWLEGVLLMATYIIIAVAAWFYPNNPALIGG